MTVVRLFLPSAMTSGAQYLAVALGVAASLAAVPGYARPDFERYRTPKATVFAPGVVGLAFVLCDQIPGAESWAQFLDFLFGLVVVLAAVALLLGRVKWWNAQLWLRPSATSRRLREQLWSGPFRARLGLDHCRLALSVMTLLTDDSRSTLTSAGAAVREVETPAHPTEA